ncbi:MAG: hypothetical protein GY746_15680 [Gammaproteobacteria bacterium]|nr:hypothetical protein [Gammaproteobacteria bacterium]
MRVLPTSDIPAELWVDEKINLAEELRSSFIDKLEELGELEKAVEGKPTVKVLHGGITDEETIDHFVYRFPTSSGRVQYAALSPCNNLVNISNAIMSTFSTGDVSVLDIPGGTGAAMCSLLTTIATLREQDIMPMLPLTVRIMTGDLSPKALEIYGQMIDKVSPYLIQNGIVIEFRSMIWDATRSDHAAKIVDEWFALSNSNSEFIVCISNFTGALIDAELFEEFSPSLNHILARLHNRKSTLVWVEPEYGGTKKLAKKLKRYFAAFVKWFKNSDGEDGALKAGYTMINPLNGVEYSSSVHVQRFERN